MSENDIDKELERAYLAYDKSRTETSALAGSVEEYLSDFFAALKNKVEQYKEKNFHPPLKNLEIAHYTGIKTAYAILEGLVNLAQDEAKDAIRAREAKEAIQKAKDTIKAQEARDAIKAQEAKDAIQKAKDAIQVQEAKDAIQVQEAKDAIKAKEIGIGLRLYAASDMNDPKEGEFLKDALSGECPWVKRVKSSNNTNVFICSFVSRRPKRTANTTNSNYVTDIADNITYWQTYGEDGFGCSIQPNMELIPNLLRVRYGDEEVNKLAQHFQKAFEYCADIYSQLSQEEERNKFADKFWECFDPIRFLYKHDGYATEAECRCVEFANQDISYHVNESAGYSIISSYVTTERLMAKKILTNPRSGAPGGRICIGPRVLNSQIPINSFAELREKYNSIRDKEKLSVEFVSSQIPYRGNPKKK